MTNALPGRRPLLAGLAALLTTALAGSAVPASAAAPAGQAVVGTLVRAYGEEHAPDTGHDAGHGAEEALDLLSWVDTGADAVRVPSADVAALPTGATVRLRVGGEVEDGAADPQLEPARDVLAAQVLSTGGTGATPTAAASTGSHEVTVVMAVPSGAVRDAATLEQVVGTVEGPVSAYWSAQTGGAVSLSVTGRRDWTALSSSCSDPTAMWREAAALTGWTPGPRKHLLLHVSGSPSSLPGCYAGLAELGGGVDAGGRMYTRYADASVIAHELGHNLGLSHAGGLQCDGTTEGATGDCTADAYRDYYDVMGYSWGQTGSISAYQADSLGVLPAAARKDVSAAAGSGTAVLSPVSSSGGLRALRLDDGTGAVYWVELRAATGADAHLGTAANRLRLQTGVTVRRQVGTSAAATLLLDPTPSPRSGWSSDLQAAVPVGATTALGSGGWHLTVRSVDGAGATVDLRRGAAPTPEPSPGQPEEPTAGGPEDAPLVPLPVVRRSGEDRYGTAVAVSRAGFPGGAGEVVVASGQDFPDALAAGQVAAGAGGPLLLVPRDGVLPAGVREELARLAPQRIRVVGGTSAVSDAVLAQLEALAPTQRLSGRDRYDTAAVAASTTGRAGGTVFLASGTGYADALAGGALAARNGDALLLSAPGTLPAPTADALRVLRPGRVVLLGGTASVSDAVRDAVAAAVPDAALQRWAGADRYATAADVAAHGHPSGASTVVLTSGRDFPDALAGAPAAGAAGAPLLLVDSTCVPAATAAALRSLSPERVVVLGGLRAVAASAADLTPC
ncbi:cell wall-binding repeat-containing protein [Quadrisphaera sp. DSM 44207]|uniref:cell wall-binding repeat-containing protein n=1 Tax=Quadrisphaera sp. DSM 44207 TaxID=1881057 RepID=UPI00088A4770|nr:cell wall-binding repeat-containing protein [Quadrisphaera sp. DSM 44207]SDQ67377.1 Putative cell wall binding repeat 2 [Quadrisphaera sp. DSM 44207]